MRSISARSAAVSTISAARTFSSRCLRDFAPGIGTMKAPAREPRASGQSDGELGERGVLPPCDGLKRRPQSEVVLYIGAVKARQLCANVVG